MLIVMPSTGQPTMPGRRHHQPQVVLCKPAPCLCVWRGRVWCGASPATNKHATRQCMGERLRWTMPWVAEALPGPLHDIPVNMPAMPWPTQLPRPFTHHRWQVMERTVSTRSARSPGGHVPFANTMTHPAAKLKRAERCAIAPGREPGPTTWTKPLADTHLEACRCQSARIDMCSGA